MPQALDDVLLERCWKINTEVVEPTLQDFRNIGEYIVDNHHNQNQNFESNNGDVIEFTLDEVEQSRFLAYNTLLLYADDAIRPHRMIGPLGKPNDAIRTLEKRYNMPLQESEKESILDYTKRMIKIYEIEREDATQRVGESSLRPIISASLVGGLSFSVSAITFAPYTASMIGFGIAGAVGTTMALLEGYHKQIAVAAATNFATLDARKQSLQRSASPTPIEQIYK